MHRSNVAVFFSLGEGKHESQCKDDIDACRFNVFLVLDDRDPWKTSALIGQQGGTLNSLPLCPEHYLVCCIGAVVMIL